jgi:Signal peptidase (SPase) II
VNRSVLDRAALAGVGALLLALGLDLGSKAWAVSNDAVAWNDSHRGDFWRRVVMCVVAIVVTYLLARGARRLGIGRLWGAWIGAGLLVGGTLGNGLSFFIWSRGVPDFVPTTSPDLWSVADFEIALGLAGGVLSIGVAAVIAYLRERVGRLQT